MYQPHEPKRIHQAAMTGVQGVGVALPYLSKIQAAFGDAPQNDLSQVKAHISPAAKTACENIGAHAYALGSHIALNRKDLRTVSHEAAHILQQRAGVHLNSGVSQAGDRYERQADEAADLAVRGESAAHLFQSPAISIQSSTYLSNATPVQKLNSKLTYPMVGMAAPAPVAAPALVHNLNIPAGNPSTSCATTPSIKTNGTKLNSANSNAGTPTNFKDYHKGWPITGGLVQDKNNKNAATKMHAINHRLDNLGGTQNNPNNIFLGTAKSNNPNHLHMVENPIINFLKAEPGNKNYVEYAVTPNYGALPTYVTNNINTVQGIINGMKAGPQKTKKLSDIAIFQNTWAPKAFPSNFSCDVTYYEYKLAAAAAAVLATNLTTAKNAGLAAALTTATTTVTTLTTALTPVVTAAAVGAALAPALATTLATTAGLANNLATALSKATVKTLTPALAPVATAAVGTAKAQALATTLATTLAANAGLAKNLATALTTSTTTVAALTAALTPVAAVAKTLATTLTTTLAANAGLATNLAAALTTATVAALTPPLDAALTASLTANPNLALPLTNALPAVPPGALTYLKQRVNNNYSTDL